MAEYIPLLACLFLAGSSSEDGPPDSKRRKRSASLTEDKWSVIWKDLPVGVGEGADLTAGVVDLTAGVVDLTAGL